MGTGKEEKKFQVKIRLKLITVFPYAFPFFVPVSRPPYSSKNLYAIVYPFTDLFFFQKYFRIKNKITAHVKITAVFEYAER